MRILLLTQLFQPEPSLLKGLAFARAIQARGDEVQVLTGFPNYPGGRVYPGYSVRLWVRDRMEGVEVLRIAHYPSHDRSSVRRMLSYVSFAVSAATLGPALVRGPDVIHVYQGPATLMLGAVAIAALRGGRIVLDIQDLWPESVTGSGMLTSAFLQRGLAAFCRWTYRRATRIVVLSEGYKRRLIERGVPAEKVHVVYNWSDESSGNDIPAVLSADLTEVFPDDRFSVVYAGSIGALQALDAVVDAALILRGTHPHVRFVFVGDGIDAGRLRDRVRTLALDNVVFVPRQPPAEVQQFLQRADALLIHLKDDLLSTGAIPQKTQAYLAAGRPIVIAVNGEAAELVERAGAGIRCRPQDPVDIAKAVGELAALPVECRNAMGRNGRAYYRAHLSFARGSASMARIFEQAAAISH